MSASASCPLVDWAGGGSTNGASSISSWSLLPYLKRLGLPTPGRPDLETLRMPARSARRRDPLRESRHPARPWHFARPRPASRQADRPATGRVLLRAELGVSRNPPRDRIHGGPDEACVRSGSTALLSGRTWCSPQHVDGEPWLADVGFGGEGLLEPARDRSRYLGFLRRAGPSRRRRSHPACCRCGAATSGRISMRSRSSRSTLIDFEMANWFTSTIRRAGSCAR